MRWNTDTTNGQGFELNIDKKNENKASCMNNSDNINRTANGKVLRLLPFLGLPLATSDTKPLTSPPPTHTHKIKLLALNIFADIRIGVVRPIELPTLILPNIFSSA